MTNIIRTFRQLSKTQSLTQRMKIIFKCDKCGQFIPLQDIQSGQASHKLLVPDSAYTIETYETICKSCSKR